jgi:hypothetical protein
MLYIGFTGKGWITYALVPAVIGVGVLLGLQIGAAFDSRSLGAGVAAVFTAVVGAPLQWIIGRRLNADTVGPARERVEHTTYGVPMELCAPFYPAFGLVMLAFIVGQSTSPLWGWLLFVLAAVPGWSLVRSARRRVRGEP